MAQGLNLHTADGIIAQHPNIGILIAFGETVPADASIGYAPGCLFIKTDGTTLDNTTYTNIGTKASSNFDAQVNA